MKGKYPFFVYGTLLSGEPNHRHFRDAVVSIHPGTVAGNLYSLGSFPMMTEGNGRVTGQVVFVQAVCYRDVLRSLDMLEGYRPGEKYNLYTRQAVPVTITENSQEITAWAYFGLPQQVNGRQAILSGSWLEYKGNR